MADHQVTTYYHVGCAYMALGRWPDAIKTFVSVLIFFVRMKPYHTRSYQYGSVRATLDQRNAVSSLTWVQITKTCERMYALLAICTTLSPGPTDESIMSIVKEHYADQLQTLQRGGPDSVEVYKDLFLSSCPKYLSVNPPPYEDASLLEAYTADPPKDATQRHLELFLSDVQAVSGVSGVRNLLKLYTSIDATKLSAFSQNQGEAETGETEMLEQLMVLKGASRTYAKSAGEGTLLDGERIVTNNLDFTIDGVSRAAGASAAAPIISLHVSSPGTLLLSSLCLSTLSFSLTLSPLPSLSLLIKHDPLTPQSMVHVEETTSHRRYAGYFIRNAEHAQRVFNTIRTSPLPTQKRQAQQSQAQGQGQGKDGQPAQGGEKKNVWQPKRRVQIAA